jgi:branched-chain amino acid transport system substrate-binding protein
MNRRFRARPTCYIVPLAALLGVVGCSLIYSFNECKTNADCQGGRTCVPDPQNQSRSFCLPILATPPGCFGIDGSIPATFGDVDAGSLVFGMTFNFTSSAGLSGSKVGDLEAIELATNEINNNGGAGNGKLFGLRICDNGGATSQLEAQVTWMTQALNLPAIMIPGSANVENAATIAIPAGTLIMSPTATSPAITTGLYNDPDSGVRMVWRTCPSDQLQGAVLAGLIQGTLDAGLDSGWAVTPATSVGVISTNDAYGTGIQGLLVGSLGSVVKGTLSYTQQNIPFTQPSFLTAIQTINNAHPNATVLVAFPPDTQAFMSFVVSNCPGVSGGCPYLNVDAGNRWFFTDSAQDPTLISAAADGGFSDQLVNAIGTVPAPASGSVYQLFSDDFQSQYGTSAAQFSYTAQSYDAMYLLSLASSFAVGANGSNPLTGVGIARGLLRVSDGGAIDLKPGSPTGYTDGRSALQSGQTIDVNGTSGPLNFDPATGQAPAAIELWGVQSGAFTQLGVIQP